MELTRVEAMQDEPVQARSRWARVAGAVGVMALAALAGIVGFLIGDADAEFFDATVVAVSSDGDSLCIDRDENSCGQPVVAPQDRGRLEPGMEVRLAELWVEQDNGERLLFLVDVP